MPSSPYSNTRSCRSACPATSRTSMAEDDGLSRAPVFVENLSAIMSDYCRHDFSSFCLQVFWVLTVPSQVARTQDACLIGGRAAGTCDRMSSLYGSCRNEIMIFATSDISESTRILKRQQSHRIPVASSTAARFPERRSPVAPGCK